MSDDENDAFREQDIFLPIANVGRIMKNNIAAKGKISKDTKECMQECVSEFISFITSEASDHCKAEKRKTICGDDIIHAMVILGFDRYIEPLRNYQMKFRENLRADRPLRAEEGQADFMAGFREQQELAESLLRSQPQEQK